MVMLRTAVYFSTLLEINDESKVFRCIVVRDMVLILTDKNEDQKWLVKHRLNVLELFQKEFPKVKILKIYVDSYYEEHVLENL